MAFRPDEIKRIKYELGYHVLDAGALPYIGTNLLFESVLNDNIGTVIETVSATPIDEAGVSTITVGDGSLLLQGQPVVVGIGPTADSVYIQSIVGNQLTACFEKVQSGTYPVTVDGPLTIVREALYRIHKIRKSMSQNFEEGLVKQVDEVKFYAATQNTAFDILTGQLKHWRQELASALGVENFWDIASGGARLGAY